MNIFSKLFHGMANWFASEPTPLDAELEEQLFVKADASVVHYLRNHPEQLPPGVTLPPAIKYSIIPKRPKDVSEEDVVGGRSALPDEPPSWLREQLRAQVGPGGMDRSVRPCVGWRAPFLVN